MQKIIYYSHESYDRNFESYDQFKKKKKSPKKVSTVFLDKKRNMVLLTKSPHPFPNEKKMGKNTL